MGLLDALFSGRGGNILDMLRQQPGGLPSDQAQYGPTPQYASPMGAMAQAPQFQAAPSQANAVPQQPPPVIGALSAPQAPMQAQTQGPGIGDRLMAGFQGFANSGGILPAIANGISGFAAGETPAAHEANTTAQALLAKGADPTAVNAAKTNPELMKQLITQHFGPQTVQSLGQGYIADKNGKITRAYEPDDKTPLGFTKDESGNLHFTKGGPADPDYQRLIAAKAADPNAVFVLGKGGELYKKDAQGNVTIVHKNDAGEAAMLSEEGQGLLADRILNGEKGVTAGFARSKSDMAGIYNKVAEKAAARGMDASDILSNINNEFAAASASRSFGGMTAKQETYSNTAAKAIDIAEKASEAVPRTTWVPVNKAILAYKEKSGDPAVAALGQSLETLTQEYARAVGGGHGTVSDKEEAREYLAKAQTHPQLVARFNIMRQEIARGRESVGESASHVGEIYRKNIRGAAPLPEPGTPEADQLTQSASPAKGPKAGDYTWSPEKGLSAK